MKMFLGPFGGPPGLLDEAPDKLLFARNEIDHAALRMPDESDRTGAAHCDRIGNLKFAVPEVGAARADDECEIVGDTEVLSVVHAHADEQFRLSIYVQRFLEIVIFDEPRDGCVPEPLRNVLKPGEWQ